MMQQLALGGLVNPARQPGETPLDPEVRGSGPGNVRCVWRRPVVRNGEGVPRQRVGGLALLPTPDGARGGPRAKEGQTPNVHSARRTAPDRD